MFPTRAMIQRPQRRGTSYQDRTAQSGQDAENTCRQAAQNEGVSEIANVLLKEAPAGPVERMRVSPAVGQRPNREQQQPHAERNEDFVQWRQLRRPRERVEQVACEPEESAEDHQWVEPDQAQSKE